MHTYRIIPCLDIKDGRVVKGINFVGLRDAGDPVEWAVAYEAAGADEIVFLDLSGTNESRKTVADIVKIAASKVSIPITVGGGIRTVDDIRTILESGANKISINSAAVKRPYLISEGAKAFGSKCIVAAIDAKKRNDGTWEVYISGGQVATGLDAVEWSMETKRLGAGEILLTSIDRDGTKSGYDIELTAQVSSNTDIPVIASGGAGDYSHFYDAFSIGKADAVLAASLFHYSEIPILELKKYLSKRGVSVRQ